MPKFRKRILTISQFRNNLHTLLYFCTINDKSSESFGHKSAKTVNIVFFRTHTFLLGQLAEILAWSWHYSDKCVLLNARPDLMK
jgi:hypothetical protein